HTKAGPVPGVHSYLYAGERTPTGGGGHDPVLPRYTADRSSDGAQPREGRADLTQARGRAQYRGPAQTIRLARANSEGRSTSQNHCDEVLAGLCRTAARVCVKDSDAPVLTGMAGD